MKKKSTTGRVGIVVFVGENKHSYPTAVAWGIDQNGILGIGVPGPRVDQNGTPINDTVAAFKLWDRVGWL